MNFGHPQPKRYFIHRQVYDIDLPDDLPLKGSALAQYDSGSHQFFTITCPGYVVTAESLRTAPRQVSLKAVYEARLERACRGTIRHFRNLRIEPLLGLEPPVIQERAIRDTFWPLWKRSLPVGPLPC